MTAVLLVSAAEMAGIGAAQEQGDETGAPTATVSFADQQTDGTMVVVESMNVSEGGFVAIHDSSLFDGAVLESVIGVSEYLEPGLHENVTVTLYDVPGATFEESELSDDETLVAMPHLDTNASETYDVVETQEVTFRFDDEVLIREQVTLEAGESTTFSTTLDTTGLEAGTSFHGVYTREDGADDGDDGDMDGADDGADDSGADDGTDEGADDSADEETESDA